MQRSLSSNSSSPDTTYRCPACKARVELSDTVCAICGEALSPMTLLRTYGAVKQLTRQVSSDMAGTASAALPIRPMFVQFVPDPQPQSAPDATADVAKLHGSLSPTTADLNVGEPDLEAVSLEQPVTPASVSELPSRVAPHPMSRTTIGLMLVCAVAILGVALFIGISLARAATTEVALTSAEVPLAAIASAEATSATTLRETAVAQGKSVAASLAAIDGTATARVAQTATPLPTAKAKLIPAISAGAPAEKWLLELASARYETSGRPAQNCGRFKANDPMRKFTFTLQVTNNTGTDLDATEWGAVAYVGEKPAMLLCYFKTEGPVVPALLYGRTQQVTLSAFIEPEQRISRIVIGDNKGNATRICLKDTQAVDCE